MKYYLIAGEASGDLHASNLMKCLKEVDPEAEFRFLGGDLMEKVGGALVKHYREMAFMGFIPVLLNLRTIMRTMRICEEDIRTFRPDVVILIDYPGFNLKIAKFVKTHLHIPVHYYISPKIWAWKKYRIRDFRRYVDRMFCILPFEKAFFAGLNYTVDYVGNPSVDSVYEYKTSTTITKEQLYAEAGVHDAKPIIGILAGSRRQEISKNLPVMLEVAARFTDYRPVIAGAPGIDPSFYDPYISGTGARVVFGKTYTILQYSEAALVTSGTATLETALFRVPQVVCYHTPAGRIAHFIFTHFFHTPFISLVNLIAGREVVKELFAYLFTSENIYRELNRLLTDDTYRARMLEGYDDVIRILGEPGASSRATSLIYNAIKI